MDAEAGTCVDTDNMPEHWMPGQHTQLVSAISVLAVCNNTDTERIKWS